MLNSNYTTEIMMAQKFIEEHKDDTSFKKMYKSAQNRYLRHSDRWALIYEFMLRHYPEVSSKVITGLTYSAEE